MGSLWVGIAVSGDKVNVVHAVVDKGDPIEIRADQTWVLQRGARASAYTVIAQQLYDYLTEHRVERVIIKGSALSQGGIKKAHLESAELRGVMMCAAAQVCQVTVLIKASMSKTFGSRKIDEYISDNDFWAGNTEGEALRVGAREAAILLLHERDRL